MTNLDSALKDRDITLPTKVYLVKAMVFPVVMCGCESWTIKKAKELMLLNSGIGLLRVPWTARRSKQLTLKEINTEYSLERLMLKLKFQYCGHQMWRTDSLEKDWERLKAGGEGDNRIRDGWKASLTQWIRVWANSVRWWRTEKPGVLQSIGSQRVRHNWATEQQQIYTYIWGFPGGSVVNNPPANAGDIGLIPGLGRSHRKGLP